ncbi:hypothetical protein [Syntrophotalea acetylenivorans]|uniref:hypothetical protein n=1 Tax=Syntrophotalea acetylenivorans TaxID=1842532 RepID=UPI000AC5ACA5|nr:hypothetical protein [Syntrophotalea acetylenivorans]
MGEAFCFAESSLAKDLSVTFLDYENLHGAIEIDGNLREANLDLVQKRWPHLITLLQQAPPLGEYGLTDTLQPTLSLDGIQLSSGYNRLSEAALQASLVPQGASQAWVYGIGSGDLPVTLLKRTTLRQLQVIILNPAVAAASFACFDHRQWLADPRVNLLTASAVKELQRPFAAVPACLLLAEDDAARLRDLVFLELATPFSREKHGVGNAQLVERLNENLDHCQRDGNVGALFDRHRGKNGSGGWCGTNSSRIF